jgi:hypothetical protein
VREFGLEPLALVAVLRRFAAPTAHLVLGVQEIHLESLAWRMASIADIWAIINIIKNNESIGTKALWVVLVLVLPVLGLVIWYFAGPKSASG